MVTRVVCLVWVFSFPFFYLSRLKAYFPVAYFFYHFLFAFYGSLHVLLLPML